MLIPLAVALLVQGAAPEVSAWQVREAPTRCTIAQQTPGRITAISTVPGSDSYRLVVADASIADVGALASAAIRFAPSGKRLQGLASAGTVAGGQRLVRMDGLPPELLDRLAESASLALTVRSHPDVAVPVSGAAAGVAALRTCEAARLIAWGADARQFEAGGRRPVAIRNRDEWVSSSDFMAVAEQSRGDVNAVFRVTVASSGTIETCRAVTADTLPAVERVVCRVVVNKRLFTPAADSAGTAVAGAATFPILLQRRPR
ncbi:hypothetical protein SAMN06297144_1993 [Sphingomonas guangdongensis]|uniref:TonB C-terminal domain-containing protein n=1 Tax=Sphingomonas guangdongensis TaxID=1141890 RepID=A0A285R3E8_9SPHN|nr:hypothetical protein [Sphingomonas guangdongensis]SOB86882.1 hypothetical protein SAMN06297144_1993 [Sphingomonas guangdongensis]